MILFLFILACQIVQQTGRSQFIVVSESQEQQLGNDAYLEILKKSRLSTRSDWQAQLRRVGPRIAAAANRPEYKWEFNVIQGKEVNAFALPGGKVAFWEGIMPVAKDDSGIAVIMGHEVAHALARHGAERMSQELGAQAIGQILALGVDKVSPGLHDDFLKLYGLGASVGVLLPWGRAQESEADQIGLTLMAKAGYDPATYFGSGCRKSAATNLRNFFPRIRATKVGLPRLRHGCPRHGHTIEASKFNLSALKSPP